ncbi:phosphatidylserine decarboxylase, putative [Plasmodium ovale]|uniref:Phosphatidylserine decarboxylase proenzyme n=2 Tax=Plasmodium ovale TaxID=36330 RepID=A0A1A8W3U1_PLAOA|nr:phosphatidylserine decarboxylase, putative [Plasmodium ovale curtisi]SBS86328.1 phosphatidylserine decarboxylase, putative [Plasmodium ovale curtisi]SCQ16266.1 phosphatidylserine decarboxylase, putative [Plasmodium ovale]
MSPPRIKSRRGSVNLLRLYKNKYVITGVTILSFILMLQYKYHEVLSVYEDKINVSQSSKLFWTRLLFGRTRSRITGEIFKIEIPHPYRLFVYNSIIKYMKINKEEIKYPIESYKSIGDFFSRYIKEETRPIGDISEYSIVSPCDSEVIDFGELKSDYLENVKGIKFRVKTFLGSNFYKKYNDNSTKMYYAIFYLSPKKYHHFHAPFNFKYNIRRHISGELFPLFRGMFKIINNLFDINERVILSGEWKGGNVYYAAISAYNVGNIKIINDDDLLTNNLRSQLTYMGGDVDTKIFDNYKNVEVGDEIGEFRMGSSIIVIFENKNDFMWNIKPNQTVSVGERLGGIEEVNTSEKKFIKIRG